jgi:peptidoglycan/LPS O-acetylase OafA/YrhL
MSGYLVGGSVLRSVTAGRWSWRSYLLARLTRLYIVLLPALLLGGAIDWAGMHMANTDAVYSGQSGMHALIVNVHSSLTVPVLAANCLFLQTIALPGMGSRLVPTFGSNGPLWSLANEFWYYMAFPLLVLMVAKRQSRWTRVICGLGLLLWGWFVGAQIALLGIPWLLGVLISVLPPFPARRRWTRGLAITTALALLGGGLVLSKLWDSLSSDLVLGSIVALLIWVTLHCATASLPTAYVRVARRAARSSYTLYLVHLPLLIFIKAVLHLPRALPGWHVCLVSMGILVGILLYAQLVYEIFEKNTDRVRNWIKPYVMGRKVA